MWQEGLDDKVFQCALCRLDLDLFTGSGRDPFFGGFPILVKKEETTLSSTFDELIGLCDELGCKDPRGKLGVWGDGSSIGIP